MTDLEKLVDQLSELTVLEAADLTKLLEEKWGVSAAAPVAAVAPRAPPHPAAQHWARPLRRVATRRARGGRRRTRA